jgi:hypothetical protein
MLSMMAIVARPWFEREDAEKDVGDILQWKNYWADHLPLNRLRSNPENRLYLVTVRPPKFDVWLVAVYDRVRRKGEMWVSTHRNQTPIVDLTAIVDRLRFESGKGIKVPAAIRPQSLQAPRILTPGDLSLIYGAMSAQGAPVPPDPGDLADLVGVTEGGKAFKAHLVRERNPRLRAAAREYWRHKMGVLRCLACHFSFSDTYGATGEDFIELHHLRPLGSQAKAQLNTVADLVPLCSNCHRMIHRPLDNPIDLKTLQAIVRKRRTWRVLADKVSNRAGMQPVSKGARRGRKATRDS